MTDTATDTPASQAELAVPAVGRWEEILDRADRIGHGISRDVDHAIDRGFRVLDRITAVLDTHDDKARTDAEKAAVRADIDRLEAELAAKRAKLRPTAAKPPDPAPTSVREWARDNGHAVSVRGKIPADVQAAYDQAHPAGGAA